MAANHVDLMDPLFEMWSPAYDQYAVAAEQMWGSEGIYIPETCGVLGWETLPDDIAESVREFTPWKPISAHRTFTDMTKRRNTYSGGLELGIRQF